MEYIAQEQSIKQVANAIREKTGDPALLEFPDEFVVAIRSIQPQQTDVIGGTVGGNQLAHNGDFSVDSSWNPTYGTKTISNGELTYTVSTVGTSSQNRITNATKVDIIANHKYIVLVRVKTPYDVSCNFSTYSSAIADSTIPTLNIGTTSANTYSTLTKIVTATKTGNSDIRVAIGTSASKAVGDVYYFDTVMVIDLTTLLGSTIADKIYTLEQSTPGAGVAIIKQLLTKDYYPFSLPDLSSIMYANDWENFGDSYILNGFLRLSNNSLYRWGDILSNGNVTRKTVRIAMTDLTWASGTMAAYEATLPNWVGSNAVEPILETVISDAYPTALYDVWSGSTPTDLSAAPDKYLYQIYESQSPDTKYYKIYIKDTSIATVSDLMTALAGKEIVYATSSESYSVAGKRFRGRADIDLPDPSSITTNGKLLTYIDSTEAAIYTLSSTSTQVLYTWQDSTDYAAAALDSGLQWEDDDNGGIVWWADDAPDLSQEDYEWFISLYEEII